MVQYCARKISLCNVAQTKHFSLFKTYEDPETFALDVGTTMSDVSIGTQTAVVTIADDDCKLLNC